MGLQADAQRKDVFFFDNGDVVDGTGLSAATAVDGQAVFPLPDKSIRSLSALKLIGHSLPTFAAACCSPTSQVRGVGSTPGQRLHPPASLLEVPRKPCPRGHETHRWRRALGRLHLQRHPGGRELLRKVPGRARPRPDPGRHRRRRSAPSPPFPCQSGIWGILRIRAPAQLLRESTGLHSQPNAPKPWPWFTSFP